MIRSFVIATALIATCVSLTVATPRALAETLPSPWQLNAQTGTVSTTAGARFRVKELQS